MLRVLLLTKQNHNKLTTLTNHWLSLFASLHHVLLRFSYISKFVFLFKILAYILFFRNKFVRKVLIIFCSPVFYELIIMPVILPVHTSGTRKLFLACSFRFQRLYEKPRNLRWALFHTWMQDVHARYYPQYCGLCFNVTWINFMACDRSIYTSS